jgi:hypothetical protein
MGSEPYRDAPGDPRRMLFADFDEAIELIDGLLG